MYCKVRNMELAEIEIANYLAYKEGWNPGLNDGIAFYNTDTNGYFIAEINNRVVGCISAVKYSEDFGFIGFFIVENEYRNSPAGTKLALTALNYLKNCNIGIDGVINRVANYTNIGFKLAYKNIRFEGIGNNYPISEKVFNSNIVNFDEILEYDSKCFPTKRTKFLPLWLNMLNAHSYVYYDNGVKGFGVIRPCKKGYKIGPLFADNLEIADQIYQALASNATDDIVYLDIPEANIKSSELVKKYEMKQVFETARMYNKYQPRMDINRIFGVTSFELG